jgi:two-component system, NarL family, sensor kinase
MFTVIFNTRYDTVNFTKHHILFFLHMMKMRNPMVKFAICKLILLFFTCAAFAQGAAPIMLSENCDTAEVDRFIKKSKQLMEPHNDSAFYYLNRAVQQSYHCNFNDRIVRSLIELGAWYYSHDIDQSIRYSHLALQEYATRNKTNTHKPNIIYKAYNILAKAFESKGVIDSSAYYYYLLNDVIEKGIITDAEYAVAVYSQLALFWLNSNWDINGGYIEPTRLFIEKSKKAEAQLKDSSVQKYISYMLQGAYYFCIKQYDSARYYYLEFVKQRKRVGTSNVTWESAMYLNVSETYLAENRSEEAIDYLQKTFALPGLAGFPRYRLLGQLYLAKAYYQQKKYVNSIQSFVTAMNDVSSNNFLTKEVIEAYKITGDSYEALGSMNKAVQYKNTYIRLHDSLMKKDKLDMMNRLQIKFRMAEKDKELAEQQLIITATESRVRKKNFWIAGISMISIFLLIVFGLWRRNIQHKQILQQKEINSFQQKMEIANLNATIEGAEKERIRIARELHDGIGGLLAAAKRDFETVKITYHLHNKPDFTHGLLLLGDASAELRKTAHNMMPEILLQEGLVEAVAYFCQTVASNKATHIHFQTMGAIQKFNPAFELTVYRIVQELVHNILKHAQATEALIQMSFSENLFDLSIEDNGIGIPEDVMVRTRGMGLKSIEDRLRTINGKMSINKLPGNGTGIYLEVPIQKETVLT